MWFIRVHYHWSLICHCFVDISYNFTILTELIIEKDTNDPLSQLQLISQRHIITYIVTYSSDKTQILTNQ